MEIEEIATIVESTGRVRHRIPGGESRPTETHQGALRPVVAEVEVDLCAEIVIGDRSTRSLGPRSDRTPAAIFLVEGEEVEVEINGHFFGGISLEGDEENKDKPIEPRMITST